MGYSWRCVEFQNWQATSQQLAHKCDATITQHPFLLDRLRGQPIRNDSIVRHCCPETQSFSLWELNANGSGSFVSLQAEPSKTQNRQDGPVTFPSDPRLSKWLRPSTGSARPCTVP